MPKPDHSPSAVIVSGGKQYRVAAGDRILVDRIAAEPGSTIKLDRVLMLVDGDSTQVGTPVVAGVEVDAKVIAHDRGPRTEAIRYKSKKRVRVHRGGRSFVTALEIVAVGGVGLKEKEEEKQAAKPKGRAKAASKKKAEAAPAEVQEEEVIEEAAPKPRPRRTRKESK